MTRRAPRRAVPLACRGVPFACTARGSALSVVFVALAILGRPAAATAATVHAVAIHGDDGGAIAATMWEPSQKPSAAVLLLHMQTRSRDDWTQFGARLADAGFTALAIDIRGLGAGSDLETRVDAAPLLADVRAALAFLAGRPDVRPGSIGIVGASMGANLAVLAGAADPSVRAIVLLSPGLDYRGLRTEGALRKFGDRPALLVASVKDPYALRSVKDLAREVAGSRESRTVEVAAHGTMLLARDPALPPALVDWLKQALP